jgi:TolA-binding protein
MRVAEFIATIGFPFFRLKGATHRMEQQLDRIEKLITDLNDAVTAETAQQKALVDELRALADDRHGAGDPARLSSIADALEASIARVKAIVPDATDDGEPSSANDETPAGQPSDAPPTNEA